MQVSQDSLDIYLIAVGGTGMAPLACLLKELGHRISGVDGPLYPPMSTLLSEAGIEPLVGYDGTHLEERTPDLVVIGNAVPRHNPEVQTVERRDLPFLSMPQALSRFLLAERRPLVVSGTHGKTTTSSMAAWVYDRCDRDPGYLIGGIPQNLAGSFRVGTGDRFVIEGDEYNAAYFDRGPKFLHYRPDTLILTSVEYDHADLYPDHRSLLDAYQKLVSLLPPDGLLVACGDSEELRRIAARAPCAVIYYGLGEHNDVHPRGLETGPDGSVFRLPKGDVDENGGGNDGEEIKVRLTVPGEHNLCNALAVWAAARHDGLDADRIGAALESFAGSKRRLEELGTVGGITVVDDFAHHPTAVEKSLGGLRQRYPGRRVSALFEPRSLTAGRAFFRQAYGHSFRGADRVFLAPIFHAGRLEDDEKLDLAQLVEELRESGIDAEAFDSIDALEESVVTGARDGDVVVTMSSGSFEGLPHRLLRRLTAK